MIISQVPFPSRLLAKTGDYDHIQPCPLFFFQFFLFFLRVGVLLDSHDFGRIEEIKTPLITITIVGEHILDT
jgi:hypothetical protein